MSVRPDPDHAIVEWLRAEATSGAPDRLVEATREQLEFTRQRRAWWPARRSEHMTTSTRFFSAAAAVAAVAVIVVLAVPRAVAPGDALASPSPTTRPSTSSSIVSGPPPVPLRRGPLLPGTYVGNPFDSVRWTVTVPAGLESVDDARLFPSGVGLGAPNGIGLAILDAGDLYSDPCHGPTGDVDSGQSADDLVNAIHAQTAYVSSAPRAVNVAGYAGRQIEVQVPKSVELASCTTNGGDPSVPSGDGGWFIWESAKPGQPNVFAQGPENRFHVRAVDVSGRRIVVLTEDFGGTSPGDLATMQTIIDSIEITP